MYPDLLYCYITFHSQIFHRTSNSMKISFFSMGSLPHNSGHIMTTIQMFSFFSDGVIVTYVSVRYDCNINIFCKFELFFFKLKFREYSMWKTAHFLTVSSATRLIVIHVLYSTAVLQNGRPSKLAWIHNYITSFYLNVIIYPHPKCNASLTIICY